MTLNASWSCSCPENSRVERTPATRAGAAFLRGALPVMALLVCQEALAQIDTTETRRPSRALRRALAPGWGQLYNRQYAKIPFVYAGFGAFGGAAVLVNSKYLRYRHAYLYTAREDPDGAPVFPEYADEYALLLSDLKLAPESSLSNAEVKSRRARLEPQIRAQRDNFRRNRDLLYFGIVIWYGLTILDAFVSAHLFDFDVGEDLTLRMLGSPAAAGVTATMRWDF